MEESTSSPSAPPSLFSSSLPRNVGATKPADEAERIRVVRLLEFLRGVEDVSYDSTQTQGKKEEEEELLDGRDAAGGDKGKGKPPVTGANALLQDMLAHLKLVFSVPVSLLSVVGESSQRFVANNGLSASSTSRTSSFCAHSILQPEDILYLPDAWEDERFQCNELVLGYPYIRFYAGKPVLVKGQAVGALCVIDKRRRSFPHHPNNLSLLRLLAKVAGTYMEQQIDLASQVPPTLVADGIWFVCSGYGKLDYVSSPLANLLHYEEAELAGRHFGALVGACTCDRRRSSGLLNALGPQTPGEATKCSTVFTTFLCNTGFREGSSREGGGGGGGEAVGGGRGGGVLLELETRQGDPINCVVKLSSVGTSFMCVVIPVSCNHLQQQLRGFHRFVSSRPVSRSYNTPHMSPQIARRGLQLRQQRPLDSSPQPQSHLPPLSALDTRFADQMAGLASPSPLLGTKFLDGGRRRGRVAPPPTPRAFDFNVQEALDFQNSSGMPPTINKVNDSPESHVDLLPDIHPAASASDARSFLQIRSLRASNEESSPPSLQIPRGRNRMQSPR